MSFWCLDITKVSAQGHCGLDMRDGLEKDIRKPGIHSCPYTASGTLSDGQQSPQQTTASGTDIKIIAYVIFSVQTLKQSTS